mgnify:CR=1 FL=1
MIINFRLLTAPFYSLINRPFITKRLHYTAIGYLLMIKIINIIAEKESPVGG